MATHGSVVQFDPWKEEWTASYVERLNYYLIANEATEDAKKCAILCLAVDLPHTRPFIAGWTPKHGKQSNTVN